MASSPLARMTRRVTAATLVVASALVITSPGQAGAPSTRRIAPTGTDSGNCLTAACATMAYAYAQAPAGEVVQVLPGVYPAQTVPSGTKAVTFKGDVNGTKIRELDNFASNVTFDGLDLDGAFAKNQTFDNHGSDNVTFRNGRIGNVTDEKGATVGGVGFVFDNVDFHDVLVTADEVHNECLFVYIAPRLTVRNSRFRNCATMDMFVTWFQADPTPPPAYGAITLENNVFGHSTMPEPGSWHYYSLYVNDTGPGGGRFDDWVVRNNTFEIPATIKAKPSSGSRWVGNLGSWDCFPGVTYSHNVGEKCSATDTAVNPPSSTRTRTAPFGWANPAAGNFRLNAGSVAIGKADPNDAPTFDADGKRRDGRPDAGAYEHGAGGAGAAGAAGTGAASQRGSALRPSLTRVRIRPATICRTARRGCPGKATLSFRLSKAATILVTAQRRRSGRWVKARAFSFAAQGSRSKAIGPRRMRAGRYRLVVRAKDASGRRSARKTVRLRVR